MEEGIPLPSGSIKPHGGFPVAQRVKNLPAVQESRVQVSGLGRSPGEGNGNPLQYYCLENSMDREGNVHGVAKSWALSCFQKRNSR